MNKKLFNILFLFVCILAVSACGQNSDDSKTDKEYIINGTRIIIPTYFRYVQYRDINSSINITLNVDNFQTVKKDFRPIVKNRLYVEIRPLREEFGEAKYWTEDDPILKAPPYDCELRFLSGSQYKFCKNGDKVSAVSWGHDLYTIYKKNEKSPISVIGCSDLDKHKSLQKGCNVRGIVSDKIQLEYHYKIEHLPRAFEIDYLVRQLVNSLIHPLEK